MYDCLLFFPCMSAADPSLVPFLFDRHYLLSCAGYCFSCACSCSSVQLLKLCCYYFPFVVRLIQFSYTHVPVCAADAAAAAAAAIAFAHWAYTLSYNIVSFLLHVTQTWTAGSHRFSLCGYLYLCYGRAGGGKSV